MQPTVLLGLFVLLADFLVGAVFFLDMFVVVFIRVISLTIFVALFLLVTGPDILASVVDRIYFAASFILEKEKVEAEACGQAVDYSFFELFGPWILGGICLHDEVYQTVRGKQGGQAPPLKH